MPASAGLRDVARRAVLAEIASVAEDLFREQGYDATTVDHIAARAGMSQRTFFRHVGTKEDLVLSGHVRLGEQVVDIVCDRPESEDVWVSLRHAFEVYVALHADPEARRRAQFTRSIVESSPGLRAAYLERTEAVQRRLTGVLEARNTGDLSRSVLRGIVGAAFAALGAATERCDLFGGADDFRAELDHVMVSIKPQVLGS